LNVLQGCEISLFCDKLYVFWGKCKKMPIFSNTPSLILFMICDRKMKICGGVLKKCQRIYFINRGVCVVVFLLYISFFDLKKEAIVLINL